MSNLHLDDFLSGKMDWIIWFRTDLAKELPSPGVEDEDASIDRLGGEMPLKGFLDGDPVHVGVVQEPDDVVVEELAIVGAGDVGLGHLGAVKLEAPPDPLPEHIEGWVGLHDLGHGLLHQRLAAREPVAKCRVEVVAKVNCDHAASG